jgi:hypothetical protein
VSDVDRPHDMTFTPDGDGGGIHECEACGYRGFDVPPLPCEPLGWWAISGGAFMSALRRAHGGEDPSVIYAEHYANSEIERPAEGDA